jgi:hypothetical protein
MLHRVVILSVVEGAVGMYIQDSVALDRNRTDNDFFKNLNQDTKYGV